MGLLSWIIVVFLGIVAVCVLASQWTRMRMRTEEIPSIQADIKAIQQDIVEIKSTLGALKGASDTRQSLTHLNLVKPSPDGK